LIETSSWGEVYNGVLFVRACLIATLVLFLSGDDGLDDGTMIDDGDGEMLLFGLYCVV